MKINFLKLEGGYFLPASSHEVERFKRFKNNEIYEVELKQSRNTDFHRKVFKFLDHCFNYWNASNAFPFFDEQAQREAFREMMTKTAGYYDEVYSFDGKLELKAKSWSYAKMSQEEFESLYHALIQVAITKIFQTGDKEILGKLYQFFD